MSSVANMTLRQIGGPCVVIRGADPQLRRNTIHDGKKAGVYVHQDARATPEENDIAGSSASRAHNVAIARMWRPVPLVT